MVPISAAIAAPTRPASISAVTEGPSSRSIATLTSAPPPVSMPSGLNWNKACAASTAPVKAPVTITTGCERKPVSAICSSTIRQRIFPCTSDPATDATRFPTSPR